MNRLAIIADDLTGASDSGVQFARQGWTAHVLFDLIKLVEGQEADVVVVDTDSRALPAPEAYRKVQEAAQALQQMGYTHLYKKSIPLSEETSGRKSMPFTTPSSPRL